MNGHTYTVRGRSEDGRMVWTRQGWAQGYEPVELTWEEACAVQDRFRGREEETGIYNIVID